MYGHRKPDVPLGVNPRSLRGRSLPRPRDSLRGDEPDGTRTAGRWSAVLRSGHARLAKRRACVKARPSLSGTPQPGQNLGRWRSGHDPFPWVGDHRLGAKRRRDANTAGLFQGGIVSEYSPRTRPRSQSGQQSLIHRRLGTGWLWRRSARRRPEWRSYRAHGLAGTVDVARGT